jgi:hypothetical protein
MRRDVMTVDVFNFNELSEEAQGFALCNRANFLLDVSDDEALEWVRDVIEDAERLQTPWFTAQMLMETVGFEMEATCLEDEYEFRSNGEIHVAEF